MPSTQPSITLGSKRLMLWEGRTRLFPPSGFVAGLYAYTDTNNGVWKAPTGTTDASLSGAIGVGRR
ncbi:MAG: hypothetical protein M9927_19990 [Anaerolineae bacterium]|nr:hypothetical protein [Anaerolineae bacterium]